MLVTRKSMFSGKTHTLEVPCTQAQLDNFKANRPLIQDAFPYCDTDQREFLLTGVTPQEWNDAFPEGDEDGDT